MIAFRTHRGNVIIYADGGESMVLLVPAFVPRGWDRPTYIDAFQRHGIVLSTPHHRAPLGLVGVVARGYVDGTRLARDRLVRSTIDRVAPNAGGLPAALGAALRDLDNESGS